MKHANAASSMAEATRAFGGLLQQGIATLALAGGHSARAIRSAMHVLLPTDDCCCEIPPPCWMPRPLGDVTSYTCPGGTATVRLRLTNCSMTTRKIVISASGDPAVKMNPPTLSLGPMERGVVAVSLTVAVDALCGEEHDVIIWVRGCQEHFLRWTVKVASRGVDSCQEVEVDDCPDLIHHWYDHFYCDRPCPHGK